MSELREVRSERTGWRDAALSARHRRWGWDCPAVDLDFLFLEYDRGKAVAIVEYKNEHAAPQYKSHPTYQALIDLADRAGIPALAVRYKDDFSEWKVVPLNEIAKQYVKKRITMTEKEWVALLYRMRGYDAPQQLLDGIDVEL